MEYKENQHHWFISGKFNESKNKIHRLDKLADFDIYNHNITDCDNFNSDIKRDDLKEAGVNFKEFITTDNMQHQHFIGSIQKQWNEMPTPDYILPIGDGKEVTFSSNTPVRTDLENIEREKQINVKAKEIIKLEKEIKKLQKEVN